METLLDLRTAVQSDLTVGSESSLYSPTTIDLAINRAKRKAEALFPWSETQDAKKTTTVAGEEYYDYPQKWRSNSIWKLKINDERYGEDPDGSPLTFDDYLNWKEDFSDSDIKKWANQERRFFVSPTPTQTGLVICVWGLMVPDQLVSDGDTTIFSYSMPECNEAIVLEAVSILKSKGSAEKAGEFRSVEAKAILAMAWNRIKMEKAKYEKNQPMFDVPDYFGNGSSVDQRGKFNIIV
jgi:hypothetical protein